MRLQVQGKITTWNDEKGFGFITPVSGGDRVFIHIKAIHRRHQRPQPGQEVYYSVSKDKQGRVCATDVAYIGKEPASPQRTLQKTTAFILNPEMGIWPL
ncbi:MAG: cold shock domain-containing protein [Kiritimatiellales bacterium]|nr:cold shock domain-containing protein [Kiritimatiellales bacterium]